MTDEQRDIIRHALGLNRRGRWSSRNQYVVYADGPLSDLRTMRDRGWLRELGPWIGLIKFKVTRAGADAAGVGNRVRREDLEA